MRLQSRTLCALAAVIYVATAYSVALNPREDASPELCIIDCSAPLITNPGWANGELANGDYDSSSKTGNWRLGTSLTGVGQLEIRHDSETNSNYLYNLCPLNWPGEFCVIAMNQVVTLQKGVDYQFEFDFYAQGFVEELNSMTLSIDTLGWSDLLHRTEIYTKEFPQGQWVNHKEVKLTPLLCDDPEVVPVCPATPSSSSALPSSSAVPSSSSVVPSSSAVSSSFSAAPSSSLYKPSPSSIAPPSSSSAAPPPAPSVDCTDPILANPGWEYGVLYVPYISPPVKNENWRFSTPQGVPGIPTEGDLELRHEESTNTNYFYNFCASTRPWFCLVTLRQVITLQAGVEYEFEFEYQIQGQWRTGNVLQVSAENIPSGSPNPLSSEMMSLLDHMTEPGVWAKKTFGPFTVSETKDYELYLHWQNEHMADGLLMIKNIKMRPVGCPSEPELPLSSCIVFLVNLLSVRGRVVFVGCPLVFCPPSVFDVLDRLSIVICSSLELQACMQKTASELGCCGECNTVPFNLQRAI
ncbi:hypothetical protein QBC34DRAFT_384328 [Podospora aff. communis PSN243]|uniref:CBM-cenC domain-containing protein n=1 Tax=Podospora aff. communis PSN243 TaxID=3040156 RepID=A0AAV9GAX9_9PEZI|nr:hypothetical protein QBC34DRAFT_384328 [Podospora aff. communis PSN243]